MVRRYTLADAEEFQRRYRALKEKKGENYARSAVVEFFRDPSRIALFAYVVLPHYFTREFKNVHYELLEHIEIGKKEKNHKATMMYRGGGKTSIQLLLQNVYDACYNNIQFIVVNSFNARASTDKLRMLKEEFENNAFIRYFYGEPIGDRDYWNKQDITVFGRTRMVALGTGEAFRGLITGGVRPQKVFSDDILSDQDVRSEELRDNALNWYKKAVKKSLAKGGVLEILNTPLNPEDLIMTIFKGEPPFNHGWDCLKLPVLRKGKSVDEDLHTTKELLRDAEDQHTFQQEMMCNPLRIESGIVKYEYLRFYDVLPKIVSASMHADITHTANQTSDYFAPGVMGKGKDGNFYLLDYVIKRADVGEQAEIVCAMYQRWKKLVHISKVTYDEKGHASFGYWTKKTAVEKYDLSLPLVPLKYPNDKVSHFQAHVPHFIANRVFFPAEFNPEYSKLLLDQLTAFPQKGIPDDAVDMLSGCLDHFHGVQPDVY